MATFHESDPLQLGQHRQPLDRVIGQIRAASEVDVTDTVAVRHQPLHAVIGDLPAVTQVDVVQVLAEPCNRVDGNIGDQPAFLQDQVAKARRNVDNLLDCGIREASARCQVEDTQMLKRSVRRNAQEGVIIDELAARQPEFAEAVALDQERGDGPVANLGTLV